MFRFFFNPSGERKRLEQLEDEIGKLVRQRDELIDANAQEKKRLSDELHSARSELEGAQRKAKHVDEDTRHLVKIKESQLDLDFQKRTLELERKKEAEIAAVKDQYRDKLETQLKAETDRIGKMYGEILARLPNVNVKLTGGV